MKLFNGILKYADKLSDVEYQIPDNCASSSDPVENLVKNPLKSSIILNYNSGITDPSYIIFKLKRYKASITHYQFSTVVSTSPPYEWTLLGGIGNNEWVTISSPEKDANICGYSSFESSVCTDQTIVQYKVNTTLGPFTEFKFNQISSRYMFFFGSSKSDLRLSGFELYGYLYPTSQNAFIITLPNTFNCFRLITSLFWIIFK